MPFKKGQPKIPGSGRRKGVQNAMTTSQTKEVADFLLKYKNGDMKDGSGKTVTMESDFCQMAPSDRVVAAIRLQALITPKPINVDLTTEATLTIEDRLALLAEENDR